MVFANNLSDRGYSPLIPFNRQSFQQYNAANRTIEITNSEMNSEMTDYAIEMANGALDMQGAEKTCDFLEIVKYIVREEVQR